MKIIFLIVLALAVQFSASDKIRITVNNYTVDSGLFVIHADAGGKAIDLVCNQDSPFCSAPAHGEYWMVNWAVPVIQYLGTYTCREVDLYPIAANPERKRKVGEYCLVES